MFGSCSATTSPGSRPAASSPAANRPDSSSSSRYVVVVPPRTGQAGASGAARADSVRMVARLKLIPAPIAVLLKKLALCSWPACADRVTYTGRCAARRPALATGCA